MIRFAIAQLNPTVGDYKSNTAKILSWIREAAKRQADIIVFPEIALSGYPVWDLANKKEFVEEGLKHLQQIVQATQSLKTAIVLGFIDRGETPSGRSRNALAWIENGKIREKYYKQLLPTYDVFLEDIFFEPGTESVVLPWKSRKVGLAICEDIWDDRYPVKPLQKLKQKASDFVINISCSPFYRGVAEIRRDLVLRQIQRYKFPMLYVNQVGAQDDLIFDGRSFFMDEKGRTLFQAPAFKEDLFFFDWNPEDKKPAVSWPEASDTPQQLYEALKLGIKDYCRKNRFKKVCIGLSGGIDSALVATLATDALGPKAVTGITMPGTYSSKGSWEDSQKLAKNLGIEFRTYPIKRKYQFLLKQYCDQRGKSAQECAIGLAQENLQARLRGLELMYVSNDESKLLLTTGNKSEFAMGYCTLYGDMAGGLAVIGDVYKTDVYRLAWWRNQKGEVIPKNTLLKAPSAELRPNQKDEDSLPPYEILDEILYHYIEQNKSPEEIVQLIRHPERSEGSSVTQFVGKKRDSSAFGLRMTDLNKLIHQVIHKVDHNEYKRRQTPPILRVTQKAWFGRRMPITNRFQVS